MKTVKDKAVIVRRKALGEADWLLTLITRRHGKIRVVAKGARRPISRLAGYCELLTAVSCHINFDPSIPIISQVTHDQLIDGVADNRRAYRSLCVLAEAVEKSLHEGDAQPALFDFLVGKIAQLTVDERPIALAQTLFELARRLGIAPQTSICPKCGRAFEPSDTFEWNTGAGGLVHASGGSLISLDEVKVLRGLARQSLPLDVRLSPMVAARIEEWLISHIEYTLDQTLVANR